MRPPSESAIASITDSAPEDSAASIASPSSSANEMAPTAPCSRTYEAGSGLRAAAMKPPDATAAVRSTSAVWRTVPRVTTSR